MAKLTFPLPFDLTRANATAFSLTNIANVEGVWVGGSVLDIFYFYAPRTSSITQTRGAGTPTETRATVATVMGYAADAVLADGQTLLTVASGELRHQGARRVSEGVWSNVDADGAPLPAATLKGAVVEAAATNLCLQSQDFATTWTFDANAGAPTANTTVAPDGTTTADTITAGSANQGYAYQTGYVSGDNQVFTASLHAKAGTSGFLWIEQRTRGGTSRRAWYNLTTGETSNLGAGVTATSEMLPDGWWRLTHTLDVGVGVGTGLAMFGGANAAGATTFTSGNTVIFWGAQVELGAYATTYIATTTAAVTRNKDVPDDQVSSNLTAAAGTVAFTWTPSHDPSGTIALCGSYVDASNYTALLHDGTDYILRKRIAATDYDATLTAAFTNGTAAKISMTWGASGINLAVDGTLGTAHANTDDAQLGTRWQWGADGNGGQQAGAAFKEMYLTTRALSDALLISAST